MFLRWARRTGDDGSSSQSTLALPISDTLFREYETTFLSAEFAYPGSPLTLSSISGSNAASVSVYVTWLGVRSDEKSLYRPVAIAFNADLSVRWVNMLDELAWLRLPCWSGMPDPVADASGSVVFASFPTSCVYPSYVAAALVSLSMSDGSLRWTTNVSVPSSQPPVVQTSQPILVASDVLVAIGLNTPYPTNGSISFFDTMTGELALDAPLQIPPSVSAPELAVSPAGDVLVYSGSTPGSFVGVNVSRWARALASNSSAAPDGFGSVLWRNLWTNGLRIEKSTAAFVPGTRDLLLLCNLSSLVAVNGTTGVVLWSSAYPAGFDKANDRLFTLTRQGIAFVWAYVWVTSSPAEYQIAVSAYNISAARPGVPAPLVTNATLFERLGPIRRVWAADDGSSTMAQVDEPNPNPSLILRAELAGDAISFCGGGGASACAALPPMLDVFPGPAPASYAGVGRDGVLSLWKDAASVTK